MKAKSTPARGDRAPKIRAPRSYLPPARRRRSSAGLAHPRRGPHAGDVAERASSQSAGGENFVAASSRRVRIPFLCSQVTPDWVTAGHRIGPHTGDAAVQGMSQRASSESHTSDLEEHGGGGIVTETYELAFRGEPGPVTRAAFPEFELRSEKGMTVFRAEFVDRAALHGVIERIKWLSLELVVRASHRGRQPMSRFLRTTAVGTFDPIAGGSTASDLPRSGQPRKFQIEDLCVPHRRLDGSAAQLRSMCDVGI